MWLVKNIHPQHKKVAIPPAIELMPGEVRRLYAVSGDYLDQQQGFGYIQILLDASTNDLTIDNKGWPFSPSICTHVFAYDAAGNVLTDTATDPTTGVIRVQTFTYQGGAGAALGAPMLTKSNWVADSIPPDHITASADPAVPSNATHHEDPYG